MRKGLQGCDFWINLHSRSFAVNILKTLEPIEITNQGTLRKNVLSRTTCDRGRICQIAPLLKPQGVGHVEKKGEC